jgi:hypothetical protein
LILPLKANCVDLRWTVLAFYGTFIYRPPLISDIATAVEQLEQTLNAHLFTAFWRLGEQYA